MRRISLLMMIMLAASVQAAPPQPIYPNPPHLATNIAADADLYWSPGDHELIVNGNFETGNLNGWSQLNNGGSTAINNGTYDPNSPDAALPPMAGNYSTINDQNGPGFQTLFQDITIPADATSAVLSWMDRIRNHAGVFANSAPLQRFMVEVRNTSNARLALIYSTEPGDVALANPAKRSADITSFRGQRIRIAFTTDQNQFFFNVHLDNISVLVKSPGTTYDIFFGTNSTVGANEFLGSTTNTAWDIPVLRPLTTYFWRLVARQGTEQTTGTVWQFTTPAIGPVAQFTWGAVSSPQHLGQPFSATITARDARNFVVTNFNEAVALSATAEAGAASDNALGDQPYAAYASYDRATVGYSFTPSSDILLTAVRHTSGEKISLWNDAGVLLTAQALSSIPGVWRETPLTSPMQLHAGQRYRLGVFSGGVVTNFARFDLPAAFAHGTIHQSYEGFGDGFPAMPHPARWWLIDFIYSVTSSSAVAITPASVNFVNGLWTGDVTVNTAAPIVLLRAEDAAGHFGLANRVSVLAAERVRFTSVGLSTTNILLTFTTVPGKTYQIERTDDLTANGWTSVLTNLRAEGGTMQVSDGIGEGKQFYRVRELP